MAGSEAAVKRKISVFILIITIGLGFFLIGNLLWTETFMGMGFGFCLRGILHEWIEREETDAPINPDPIPQ